MLLILKHLTLLLLVGASAPSPVSAIPNTIKGAEVAKCVTCVTAAGRNNNNPNSAGSNFSFSWIDGSCSDDATCGDSSDPSSSRCCIDARCCTEDGCRSPDDSSCAVCCDEVSLGDGGVDCVVRSWSPDGSDGVLAPWYNDETYDTTGTGGGTGGGGRVGCDPNCPPCAVCSTRDETELTLLSSGRSADLECTAEDCQARIGINYFVDPCQFNSPSDDCDCFCWLANPLLDDCPHLSEEVFNPMRQEPVQEDPVQEDPVEDPQDQDDTDAAGGTGKVDDSFGDVPAGEKQVARTASSGAAAVRVTLLLAVCFVGAIQLFVLS